ncbi:MULTISPECIES: hypothetical protein [Pseudonocardia]|uniref:Uncharacterized protein n=1 Tax=Pseudonocardia oroxyli TaxID=366584 RepID=A0A1G7QBJ1_PSEOR|nr:MULTISPECIES: hypothetical protein [Pseudonocardia]MCF7551238.1 hypothetical protein [Pseudonocardia sp. WMMC193]SDF94960.1 hypothetical protein SAMN05216377_1085 [Pseudonocardia oroxyli]
MWAFFSKRLRLWLILAIGVPLGGWALGKTADLIERRRGPNQLTRSMRQARGWLQRRSRGPLASRLTEKDRPAR